MKERMQSRLIKRKNEIFGTVRVKPPFSLPAFICAAANLLFPIMQIAVLLALYAFAAYAFPVFRYVSFALTGLTCVYILFAERDVQCKISWILLMLISCGCGYIVYILANKKVCYWANKRRFNAFYRSSKKYVVQTQFNAETAVKNDCTYLYNAGGFAARTGTDIKYFGSSEKLIADIFERFEKAEKFIFLEFFIVANGALSERLLQILKRKTAEGVEVRLLYDDLGSINVLYPSLKNRLKKAGVKLVKFSPIAAPFSFGLNFRDHRKIVVVDGRCAYVCGFNIADECVNARRMEGRWKDAGVRLEGSAVDDTTLIFLRQWDFAAKCNEEWDSYIGLYENKDNDAVVVSYAGGPDLTENVCRGAFANVVSGAREKLFIMSPYFIPDKDLLERLKERALSGVDVRLILPAVPDWKFIYRLTKLNAERLIPYGVKVYYVQRTFLHSKVIISENCAIVGSVNVDMRSFYQQFENAVYTNDLSVMKDINLDFNSVFALNSPAVPQKRNVAEKLINGFLKILSPLM